MGNIWLKIKVWTKAILALAVFLYVLVFIAKNNDRVRFWWWYNREDQYSMLLLIAISFVAGVVCTILFRTTLRTIRQIRDLRTRSRTDKIERELADMKEKASRLQTKPTAATTSDTPPSDI